jgi:hypothetical protein
MSDDRDAEIQDLKAEIEGLRSALESHRRSQDRTDEPLFGHGLSGGALGGLEVAVAAFALMILFLVARHLIAAG